MVHSLPLPHLHETWGERNSQRSKIGSDRNSEGRGLTRKEARKEQKRQEAAKGPRGSKRAVIKKSKTALDGVARKFRRHIRNQGFAKVLTGARARICFAELRETRPWAAEHANSGFKKRHWMASYANSEAIFVLSGSRNP